MIFLMMPMVMMMMMAMMPKVIINIISHRLVLRVATQSNPSACCLHVRYRQHPIFLPAGIVAALLTPSASCNVALLFHLFVVVVKFVLLFVVVVARRVLVSSSD